MDRVDTDLLLVRCRVPSTEGLAAAAERFCREAGGLRLQRVAWCSEWAYVYAQLPRTTPFSRADLQALDRLWRALCPAADAVDLSRLELLQDLPGRSRTETATCHYVVETDPETGWEGELARWYAEEHMPGLAAVPGCVHARRYRNHDAGPASHACYALVREDVLGCPPWLQVRGTEWSSRVRPHFTNTRRTMMELLA